MNQTSKPIVFITGAAGNIGSALTEALQEHFTVIGLDRNKTASADSSYEFDLTSRDSVTQNLEKIAAKYGRKVAAVIHLAAYFDFTGETSPLYNEVNVEGTRNLLRGLASFNVERFIYSSTMLVHRPGRPGEKTTEVTPLKPGWAYPESKLETEKVVRLEATMPFTILRLAGLYNSQTAVPTLANQIARIYEEDLKSYLYSGDTQAGQAFLHQKDMEKAFLLTVERRSELPEASIILIGEEECVCYEDLQNQLGELIHGEKKWQTITVPPMIAKFGAWAEEKAEPIIPDDFDHGEKPFIRPFMIDMASDHYSLDCSRAQTLLGWHAEHRIRDQLPNIIASLKRDPLQWYQENSLTPPDWMIAAEEKDRNPEILRERYEHIYQRNHRQAMWARFTNIGLAAWLITSPPILNYAGTGIALSDIISGVVLLITAGFSLSHRHSWARWASGAIGMWLLFAPLAFWTTSASAYLNDTLLGMLILGFALMTKPVPGVSPVAELTGPTTPEGWDFNPSSWFQRMPIIALAFIGFFISRYLTAYQLGHIEAVWDPFFTGGVKDPQNGTEEIITSTVSEAWPVPDAGVGALTYALEILTGLMGSTRRWRTMPWLVILFGIMIVPLGIVSVSFIIIQPILIGTWCTLCLFGAAAMLLQIPYSLDELVATGQFLKRRYQAGRPLLKIFFVGDTDSGDSEKETDEFGRGLPAMIKDAAGGGINLPWNIVVCIAIGIWLMFTRITLDNGVGQANWEHFVGAMVVTIGVSVFAEVARPARFLIIPFAAPLLVVPFIYDATWGSTLNSVLCGMVLMVLTFPRGKITHGYGSWNRFL